MCVYVEKMFNILRLEILTIFGWLTGWLAGWLVGRLLDWWVGGCDPVIGSLYCLPSLFHLVSKQQVVIVQDTNFFIIIIR